MNEAEVLMLLKQRYTQKAGNGDAYAFMPHVRNAAGFDSNRTADAIVLTMWPSRGLSLQGFEVKCSRADWRKELATGAKAEAFAQYCDRWWIVVADPKIVHDGELPEQWGLLAVRGKRLVCIKEAPRLRDKPVALPRTFLVPLIRSAISEAVRYEIEAMEASVRKEIEDRAKFKRDNFEKDLKALKDFEEAAGIRLRTWMESNNAAAAGAALRAVINGDQQAERHLERLRYIRSSAARLVEELDKSLGEPSQPA